MLGKIGIVIADDHRIFREGLKQLLRDEEDFVVLGEVGNGRDLMQSVKQLAPDVIITDIKMPLMDGIEATRKICTIYPGSRVIALSSFSDDYHIIDMLEAGALGFLLKNVGSTEICAAIRSVNGHKPCFSHEITEKLTRIIAGRYNNKKSPHHVILSETEKEIIRHICRELTSKQIADRMRIGKRTVESYRMRIMDKLGVNSVAPVIAYAIHTGLFRKKE